MKEFGPFRLDLRNRILYRSGERVELMPKALDVLVALVKAEGELVSKDDLLKKVWPDTFVEESSLAQNVSQLRKALGEGSWIETIPKRGYRFTGPSEAAPVPAADDPPRPLWKTWAAVAAVAGLALAAWAYRGPSVKTEPVRSMVVLPFANLTGDPNSEYLADGLTEEITDSLARVPELQIVARTSAFVFKGKYTDVREIGQKLNVDAALEGSIRREGSRLRVTAQLNNTKTGYHYWSRTWEDDIKDVFGVQKQIAEAVASALGKNAEVAAKKPPATVDAEAYDLLQRALSAGQHLQYREAVGYAEAALARDPNLARAWSLMGGLYALMGNDYVLKPKEAYPVAKRHLDRANGLDPENPTTLMWIAWVNSFYDWDWAAAEKTYRQALALPQGAAQLNHNYSHFLVSLGRFPEALEESRRALDRNVLSPSMVGHMSWYYRMAGEPARAIEFGERALSMDSTLVADMIYLTYAYEAAHRMPDAIRIASGFQSKEAVARLREGFEKNGEAGYWKAAALNAEEGFREHRRGMSPYLIASKYAQFGAKREAYQWLRQAFEERDSWLVYLKVEPAFTSLRGDAEFQAMIRQVGLP